MIKLLGCTFSFFIFLGRSSFRGNPWSLNDHAWIYVMLSLKGLDQTLCIWNVKSEFGSKKCSKPALSVAEISKVSAGCWKCLIVAELLYKLYMKIVWAIQFAGWSYVGKRCWVCIFLGAEIFEACSNPLLEKWMTELPNFSCIFSRIFCMIIS